MAEIVSILSSLTLDHYMILLVNGLAAIIYSFYPSLDGQNTRNSGKILPSVWWQKLVPPFFTFPIAAVNQQMKTECFK